MGLISRVSSRTYRRINRKPCPKADFTSEASLPATAEVSKPNPWTKPSSSSKESTTTKVANGTWASESLSSTNPPRTPWSLTARNPDPESSGARSCEATVNPATSKSSSPATCLPPNSPAESELCFTRFSLTKCDDDEKKKIKMLDNVLEF